VCVRSRVNAVWTFASSSKPSAENSTVSNYFLQWWAVVSSERRSDTRYHATRALGLSGWLYKHDSGLRSPYQDHLSALIHDQSDGR
jgi:hypothetical protein